MSASLNPSPRKTTGAGAVLLAAGGVLAGFATASCCALPILLGTLGLGSAGLFHLALLAAPHRTSLLIFGAAAIVGAALLLWRQSTQSANRALCVPNRR